MLAPNVCSVGAMTSTSPSTDREMTRTRREGTSRTTYAEWVAINAIDFVASSKRSKTDMKSDT